VIGDPRVIKKIQAVFESDWEHSIVSKADAPLEEKAAEKLPGKVEKAS
jgi:hypothetical protein